MKWLQRGLGALALLVLAGLIAGGLYARAVLPQTEGVITVPGMSGTTGEVRIERDADGIPSIHAASREAAYFGLGFVHAQDRLWQLETHRRIGSGRLAEAFGASAVDNDKFLRALGVRRTAALQWQSASAETRAAVLAYTDGINSFLQHEMKARPPEMVLLGLQPEPWTPEDSLAWAVMMAWDLGGNWSTELLRMRLALKMPVERINQLLPPYPGDKPLATADYATLFRSLKVDGSLGRQALLSAPESGVEGVGSNNWVLDGTRTTTGKPLLANDPHLKLTTPALWYFARLHAPGFNVAGATMPGLPMVVLGQNDQLAWGFTNTAPDVQDLYLERIHADDPAQYQTPDGWARFESFDEVIKVRGGEDVPMTVRTTRHGPVISDAGGPSEGLTGAPSQPGAQPKGQASYAIAMRWTALDTDADLLEASLASSRMTTVDDFVTAVSRHVAPMQNIVVADTSGRIAMAAGGRVPVRGAHNDLKGLVPAPGWQSRYDWTGYLPGDQTPREIAPKRGWIATANQRIHGPEYPHFITSEWSLPYRQQRIEQLLQATPKHDVASLRAMQADEVSLAARRLLPFIRAAKSSHPLAQAAQHELANFDGTMAADRAAPLILWAWTRQLTEGLFADELGAELYQRNVAQRAFRDALEGVLDRQDAWWCDDKSTPAAETCAQQVDAAFTRALDEVQAMQGADVAKWQWGRAHVSRAEHRPFSNVGALARWFETRTPVGGDTYTVNVSKVMLRSDPASDARTGGPYRSEHGPSLRAIYDLGDKANSRFVQSSGQSGIVFSGWYRSFTEPWRAVKDVPVWESGAVDRRLVLKPGG
jgi:penicillin amidase